jgi:3-oxoacyl-[acyl-carrier protein] reductase
MGRLAGKVAVVTGASKGIGASIAEHFAAEGASVVVNYANSKSGADAIVKLITDKGGKASAVQGDVSKAEYIKRLFAETKKQYGKLDILVNNAGIYEFAPLAAITPEHFHKQFDLNVLGLLLTTQEAVKLRVVPSLISVPSSDQCPPEPAPSTVLLKQPLMRLRSRYRWS